MEVTRALIEQTFPFGAWYVPTNDSERSILVGPFEFDEEDEELVGSGWAHPNKAFTVDFSEAVEKEAGWLVKSANDQEVFIRPATEASWNELKPRLED